MKKCILPMLAAIAFLHAGCGPPPPPRQPALATGGPAIQPGAGVTRLPAGMVLTPVLLPDSIATGRSEALDVLSPQETKAILDQQMPAVTDANRDTPVDEVIRSITGRRLLWVPPENHAGASAAPIAYGTESASVKGRTLGQYLRGLIGGSTSLGYPRLRMARTAPAAVASAPFGVPPAVREQPEMMDVILVTRKHIVILAVPRE